MTPSLGTRVRQPFRWKLRRLFVVVIALLILISAVRVLSIQGLIKPVRVVSGSMAPALLGPRYEIACGDCGYMWSIDAGQTQGDDRVVCPNCGYSRNELSPASLRAGERVLIDRGVFWLRRPRRFEAVAFRDPATPDRLAVKRIAALPGESLEVRGGELFIGGRIVRKSLAQFRSLAVPVYDDRFRPQDDSLPPRWRDDEGEWAASGDAYYYAGDLQPSSRLRSDPQFAWLAYRHWRCSSLPGLRTKETPVLDDSGYNLGPSRQLNFVTDLALECRVKTAGEGCLAVALDDGRRRWQIRLWPRRGELSLYCGDANVAHGEVPRQDDEDAWRLEAAICDGQILAAIDGREVFTYEYEVPPSELRPSSRPFALGAAGLAVEASELVISRDVYYLPPPGRRNWKIGRLGEEQYVLLGDNAAVSLDSRTWKHPEIGRKQVLGPVARYD